MVLFVGLAVAKEGEPVKCDEDGTPVWKPTGGILAVITGVYTMTPETANGRGSFPLVGDGKVPGVEVQGLGYSGLPEPVGANDLVPAGGDGPGKGAAPAAAQPAP